MKSPWLVACDFNHYTAILTLRLIILMAGSLIIVFTCIWPLAWRNNWSHYNLSTPLLWFLTFSIVSQREREATKNERTHHGAVDKSWSELQIRGSASIFCIVRKNWAHTPTASGSYGRMAGWLAGWPTKCG